MPLDFSVAFQDDLTDIGIGLDIVEDGGLAEQTLDRREGRTGTGLAAVALYGSHERGLLAAHERARAQPDVEIEIKAGAEDVLAEQSVLLRLREGYLQPLHRDGVLRPDVDIALMGADGIARDRHSFEDGVRIAFEYAPVHERAGVALVGVAADILDLAGAVSRELPFETRRETAAASAAQSRALDYVDDFLRLELGQALDERLIAVVGDILVYLLGVDDAAVAKRDAGLLLVEIGVRKGFDGMVIALLLVKEALHQPALDDMLVDYLGDILHLYAAVKCAFRVDDDDGTRGAQTEATGAHHRDIALESSLFDEGLELFLYRGAVVGVAPRAAAHQNMTSDHILSSLFQPLFIR